MLTMHRPNIALEDLSAAVSRLAFVWVVISLRNQGPVKSRFPLQIYLFLRLLVTLT